MFTKQKHYDGGPNSIKILVYKLKKLTCESYITKLKDDITKIIIVKEDIAQTSAKIL